MKPILPEINIPINTDREIIFKPLLITKAPKYQIYTF